MKIELWYVGKTSFPYIKEGMDIYEKRLKHYLQFQTKLIPNLKKVGKLPPNQIKIKEGEQILKQLSSEDVLVLLDERGKTFSSVEFSRFLESKFLHSRKKMVFLIGGAFGFSDSVYARADSKLSLSKMTFSHQMIRIFAMEQIYRAMTIIKGESYHNEG